MCHREPLPERVKRHEVRLKSGEALILTQRLAFAILRVSPVCQSPWREQKEDGIETPDKGERNLIFSFRLLITILSFAFGVGGLL
jgi:hypothetical protein